MSRRPCSSSCSAAWSSRRERRPVRALQGRPSARPRRRAAAVGPRRRSVAYREAVEIAPDRALPYTSLGGVLAKSRPLRRSRRGLRRRARPGATGRVGLRGRADALVAAGRPADAAETLDRLSRLLDEAGPPGRRLRCRPRGPGARRVARPTRRRRGLRSSACAARSGHGVHARARRALEILREPASRPRTVRRAEVAAPTGRTRRRRTRGRPHARPHLRAARSDRRPARRRRGGHRRPATSMPSGPPRWRPRPPSVGTACWTPPSTRATWRSASPRPTRPSTWPSPELYLDRGWRVAGRRQDHPARPARRPDRRRGDPRPARDARRRAACATSRAWPPGTDDRRRLTVGGSRAATAGRCYTRTRCRSSCARSWNRCA